MNLFDKYLEYVGKNETPNIYHRWALTSITSALCGRRIYIPFGHRKFYSALYIIFLDSPASRKTTAIKTYAAPLLHDVGYPFIAADRTSKEQLWVDLQDGTLQGIEVEKVDKTDEEVWNVKIDETKECMLLCNELADFMAGSNTEDFATHLGNMWDLPEPYYVVRNKSVRSARLFQPTINLLGATTPIQLSKVFGANAIGTGCFSRVLFIRSPRRKPKTRPTKKDPKLHKVLVEQLIKIYNYQGEAQLTKGSIELSDAIYHRDIQVADIRLQYYYARRFEQLQRLTIPVSMLLHQEPLIDEAVVRYANTQLYLAEIMMPKALGEYGIARSSDLSQIVLDAASIYGEAGIDPQDLYRYVSTHVEGRSQFQVILQKLVQSGKLIHEISGGSSKLYPNQEFYSEWDEGMVDYSLVSPEENPYDAGLLKRTGTDEQRTRRSRGGGDIPKQGKRESTRSSK